MEAGQVAPASVEGGGCVAASSGAPAGLGVGAEVRLREACRMARDVALRGVRAGQAVGLQVGGCAA